MKKLITFFIVFVTLAVFFTCCKPSMTPERVVDKYLTHISEHEYEEAAKYCTEETGRLLMVLASMSEDEEPTGQMHEHINCEINDDKAQCTYNVKGQEETEIINLIRIDDEWLIHEEK